MVIKEKLTNDEYYYGDARKRAISASDVMPLNDGTYDPDKPQEWKPHYEVGRYFHVQTLEPEKIGKFDIRDVKRRMSGEEFLKQGEVDMCKAMKQSHDSHPEARGVIYGPGVQYEVPEVMELNGVQVIGKCDILNPMIQHLGDLKSTSNFDYFEDSVEKWYCPQLYVYWKLFNLPTVYVVTEKAKVAPRTKVIYPTRHSYERGRELTLSAIEIYKNNFL